MPVPNTVTILPDILDTVIHYARKHTGPFINLSAKQYGQKPTPNMRTSFKFVVDSDVVRTMIQFLSAMSGMSLMSVNKSEDAIAAYSRSGAYGMCALLHYQKATWAVVRRAIERVVILV